MPEPLPPHRALRWIAALAALAWAALYAVWKIFPHTG